ncbi:plastocyanin/azurin family copper-binding protein [Halobacterium zhouii]|uniref:plastocyanin/azurin family copper-binding protein n=1 Tax=Halobacterium zhouii TaxID=2902624 RepID=UPI001E4A7450|nr:plastocyanin/azurin family copper-binding protein [Halobacterium zhouii]
MPTRRQLLRSGGTVGLIALVAGCARPPSFGDGTGEPATTEEPGTTARETTPAGTTDAPETTQRPQTTAEETTAEPTTEEPTTAEPTESTQTTSAPETTAATPPGEVVDVAVGPEGRLRFAPERVELTVGDTIRWTFESAGHNVTSLPGASEKVQNPAGAEPFASYEESRHYAIEPVGATFQHTFTVAGEYVYVCEPHSDQGMVGYVTVTEQ